MLCIGAAIFWSLRKPFKVNLLRIYVVAFVLHFGLMPIYGFVADWAADRQWGYTSEEIWSVYGSLYLFLATVLLMLFLYDRMPKRFRRGWSLPNMIEWQYNKIGLRQAIWIFVVVMGFMIGYNIFFGYTYYGSGSLERNLSVPYPLVVVKSLFTIFVYGLIGYGALHLLRGKKYLLFGLLLLCSNNLLDWYSRRNYMIVFIVLVLLKLILDRFRTSTRQVLVTGAALAFVWLVFFPFLFVFRSLTNEVAASNKGQTDFNEAFEATQGSRGHLLSKGLGQNTTYRSNQVARNIEFMRLPGSEGNYMNGLLLATQITSVVPRALNPSKLDTRKLLAPEGIILFFYGKKDFDLSDNFPLYGYLEFGFVGVLFAGIGQALFLILFEWFAHRFQRIHPFLGLSVLMLALYNHLNLEYPFTQELGFVRDLLILFCISWPISMMLKIFGRHSADSSITQVSTS